VAKGVYATPSSFIGRLVPDLGSGVIPTRCLLFGGLRAELEGFVDFLCGLNPKFPDVAPNMRNRPVDIDLFQGLLESGPSSIAAIPTEAALTHEICHKGLVRGPSSPGGLVAG
jgi:hypothetical protein